MALPARRRDHATPPPARWDPFRELEELHDRIGRLMQGDWPAAGDLATEHAWSPPVDIEETDDACVVEAELPGVKREDVQVELRDGELSITGEAKKRERTGFLRARDAPHGLGHRRGAGARRDARGGVRQAGACPRLPGDGGADDRRAHPREARG